MHSKIRYDKIYFELCVHHQLRLTTSKQVLLYTKCYCKQEVQIVVCNLLMMESNHYKMICTFNGQQKIYLYKAITNLNLIPVQFPIVFYGSSEMVIINCFG